MAHTNEWIKAPLRQNAAPIYTEIKSTWWGESSTCTFNWPGHKAFCTRHESKISGRGVILKKKSTKKKIALFSKTAKPTTGWKCTVGAWVIFMKCRSGQTPELRIVRSRQWRLRHVCFLLPVSIYYDPIGFSKHAISFRSILNVAIEAGVMVADVQCSTGAILGRVHVPKFKIRKSAFELLFIKFWIL